MKRKVFNINGGLGRCVAATGVIKKYVEDNPKEQVYVVTGFPEVFFNIRGIERVYPMNTPYIFEDLIKESIYEEPEPYKMFEYYNEEKHITACFNKEINGCDEIILPSLNYSDNELKSAEQFVKSHDKPVILFQPYGSMGGLPNVDPSKRSLQHDFAEKLCKKLSKKYQIYLIKEPKQKGIDGVKALKNTARQIGALIPHVHAVIGVDSFLQHAAAQFDTKTIVFWGATRTSNLGYDKHINYTNGSNVHWSPIRMISNDLEQNFKNEGADKFDDSYIDKVYKELAKK